MNIGPRLPSFLLIVVLLLDGVVGLVGRRPDIGVGRLLAVVSSHAW